MLKTIAWIEQTMNSWNAYPTVTILRTLYFEYIFLLS